MNREQPGTKLATETSAVTSENSGNLRTSLMRLVLGFQASQAISVAAQLNLADLLKDQTRTDLELAEATGTNPAALYRLLRVLANVEVLAEVTPHHFALTQIGQLLQKGVPGSVYTASLFFSSPRIWQVWQDILYSVQTGENATQHVFGVPTWEYYAQHPEEAPIFYNFMTESSNQLAPLVAANYKFEGMQVVADIGGAQGNMLAAILRANSHLKGVLFDLPQVTQGATHFLEGVGVAERCEIVAGDMFSPWPFKADLYLISRVIHDWADEQVIAILRNCREAMEPTSKLVVVERILPEDKEAALLFLLSDLHMLVGVGGQERSLEEYQKLFQAAGLTYTRHIALNPSFCLIEAVRA